jgi:hypothetical protein
MASPDLLAAALAAALLARTVVDPAGYQYYVAPGAAFLPLVSRQWRWPIGSLAGGLLLAHFLPGYFDPPSFRVACLNTLIMTAGLLAALVGLRTADANERPSNAEREKGSGHGPEPFAIA